MPRSSDARKKALTTAEALFRRQGYAATGLAQIIAESSSPKGSFYFYFPRGKDQVAAEVIESFSAVSAPFSWVRRGRRPAVPKTS